MKAKSKLEINKESEDRIIAFKKVIEAVIDEEIELNDCIEIILDRGINSMTEDILGQVDSKILLLSFQQLGSKYPLEVYSYIADTIQRGEEINKKELKRNFGFEFNK